MGVVAEGRSGRRGGERGRPHRDAATGRWQRRDLSGVLRPPRCLHHLSLPKGLLLWIPIPRRSGLETGSALYGNRLSSFRDIGPLVLTTSRCSATPGLRREYGRKPEEIRRVHINLLPHNGQLTPPPSRPLPTTGQATSSPYEDEEIVSRWSSSCVAALPKAASAPAAAVCLLTLRLLLSVLYKYSRAVLVLFARAAPSPPPPLLLPGHGQSASYDPARPDAS